MRLPGTVISSPFLIKKERHQGLFELSQAPALLRFVVHEHTPGLCILCQNPGSVSWPVFENTLFRTYQSADVPLNGPRLPGRLRASRDRIRCLQASLSDLSHNPLPLQDNRRPLPLRAHSAIPRIARPARIPRRET